MLMENSNKKNKNLPSYYQANAEDDSSEDNSLFNDEF